MREVLQDEIFWALVMPWALFIGLFILPRQPYWLRHYVFPGVYLLLGVALMLTLAKGVGVMSIFLGLIAWWATGENKQKQPRT